MAAAATGFNATLAARWAASASLLCVGIDPEPGRYPSTLVDDPDRAFTFGKAIIDATAEFACAFKPQIAHFAAQGAEDALERLIAYVHAAHPGIPVILDAKRGDIGSTALNYAREAFDRFRADAVTANPYLGSDSLAPYLERADKGVVVLCRTSNPGAADLQDLPVASADGATRHSVRVVWRDRCRGWKVVPVNSYPDRGNPRCPRLRAPQSQLSAPPVWYSVTRRSKKFCSFFRSSISLIHGNGFSAPGNSGSRPICCARRLAMKRRYSLNIDALRPSTPRGIVSSA